MGSEITVTATEMIDQWFFRPDPRESPSLRLFCFPYAGAGPRTFRSWTTRLPDGVEFLGIRLPGREKRVRETRFTTWPLLINSAIEAIGPLMQVPFVFVGHCCGVMLAYEIAKAAMRNEWPLRHFIASGRRPPDLPPIAPTMHHLPSASFRQHVLELGSTPPEVVADEKMMRLLEPTLRADIQLDEIAECCHHPPLAVPVTAMCSENDRIAPSSCMPQWKRFTTSTLNIECFPGGHFFCHSCEDAFLNSVARICETALAGSNA